MSINNSTGSSTGNGISPQSIVVAGCGAMGYPMALQLLDHGHTVSGFDVRPTATLLPENSSASPFPFLTTLDDLSAEQILWVVVRDEAEITALCFDEQAVFRQAQYPSTVVISSTVSPRYIHRLNELLPTNVTLIDAPMSGAPYAAKAGTLTFMVGGSTDAIGAIRPCLDAMGNHVHHVGPVGAGMLIKVMNNYVAAASVVAVRRSLDRAAANGVDSDLLLTIMSQSSGATWYGDHANEIEWAQQHYDPANTIGILEKDVQCSLGTDLVTTDAFDQALLLALKQLPHWPKR